MSRNTKTGHMDGHTPRISAVFLSNTFPFMASDCELLETYIFLSLKMRPDVLPFIVTVKSKKKCNNDEWIFGY